MMHFFGLVPVIFLGVSLLGFSAKAEIAQPVAQSLVIECKLRVDETAANSPPTAPCGPTKIDIRNLDTKKNQSLSFDGGIFVIPVHADFGRFRVHVQPKRCPKNKDSKTALVGSVTTLTFEHCQK